MVMAATSFRVVRPLVTEIADPDNVPPPPGLDPKSVLGCGYGRDHHCHWIWWQRIGRFCCHRCQPEVWNAIPKAKHDPKW